MVRKKRGNWVTGESLKCISWLDVKSVRNYFWEITDIKLELVPIVVTGIHLEASRLSEKQILLKVQ